MDAAAVLATSAMFDTTRSGGSRSRFATEVRMRRFAWCPTKASTSARSQPACAAVERADSAMVVTARV